jgi:transcriptional regulator with PAS, ATPase and Fis domain
MSDRRSIVSDPEVIRARAMETLFERLENLCEGAIAIDRAGRIVYVNEKYLHSLRLNHVSEAIGRPIEEIIPNSLMRRVAETGKPILLDIMELGGEQLVVTRMPIEDENRNVIGAIGFVLSDHIDNLKPLITRMSQLESDLRLARRQLSQGRTARFTFDDYVGETAGIARAKELAVRAARQNVTVLLTGETGTGKELLAQAIHNASPRGDKPFVSINVAAIPDTLIESEFFGTVPGAYTGADRKGRAAGARNRAGRIGQGRQGQCSCHRCDECRLAKARQRGGVPGRSLLPAQCAFDRNAATARLRRRSSVDLRKTARRNRPFRRLPQRPDHPLGAGCAGPLRLAGKRQGVAQYP